MRPNPHLYHSSLFAPVEHELPSPQSVPAAFLSSSTAPEGPTISIAVAEFRPRASAVALRTIPEEAKASAGGKRGRSRCDIHFELPMSSSRSSEGGRRRSMFPASSLTSNARILYSSSLVQSPLSRRKLRLCSLRGQDSQIAAPWCQESTTYGHEMYRFPSLSSPMMPWSSTNARLWGPGCESQPRGLTTFKEKTYTSAEWRSILVRERGRWRAGSRFRSERRHSCDGKRVS